MPNAIRQRFVDPSTTARQSARENPADSGKLAPPRAAHRAKRLWLTAPFHFNSKIAPRFKGRSPLLRITGKSGGEIVMRQLCRRFCKIESSRSFLRWNLTLPQIPLQDGSFRTPCPITRNNVIEVFPGCGYIEGISLPLLNLEPCCGSTTKVRYAGSIVVAIALPGWNRPCFEVLNQDVHISEILEVWRKLDFVPNES